ncbi:Spy/CpxP family protein refolding chaperone [Azorhizobium sp. AG788]|uniref:Spy/CpxP family protein refolding chaperone n=1 Tax=Azorhizobium sp. AG788 TaxID=2183897 RepID=UPI003138F417
MTRTVSHLLAAGVLASALAAGSGAMAQQPPAPPAPPAAAAQPAPAPVAAGVYTDADARAILNARLAALKAVIELTPDQEKLWPPVEAAVRDIAKNAIARRQALEAKAPPSTFLDVLEEIATAEETRGKELRRFVDAARPFVASLTPAQKRRVPAFLGLNDTSGPHQPSGTLWLFEEEAG